MKTKFYVIYSNGEVWQNTRIYENKEEAYDNMEFLEACGYHCLLKVKEDKL